MDENLNIIECEFCEEYPVDERAASCFFSGHRMLPEKKDVIFAALKNNISYLYSVGVRNFHAGGALGFDTIAATTVIDLKRFHPDMKLVLNLPYHNQFTEWSKINVERYEYIKKNADKIVYTYDGEVLNRYDSRKYLLKRNCDMVNCSKYGIVYFSGKEKSGTGYTVRYAEKQKCDIRNIYE